MAEKTNKQLLTWGNSTVEVTYGRSHRYKPISLSLMMKSKSGWVLDVGGGYRTIGIPNFINLDISRKSHFVNVIADSHFLPFRNDVFSTVTPCLLCYDVFDRFWVVEVCSAFYKYFEQLDSSFDCVLAFSVFLLPPGVFKNLSFRV